MAAARGLTVTISSEFPFSSAIRQVMIFVVLAIPAVRFHFARRTPRGCGHHDNGAFARCSAEFPRLQRLERKKNTTQRKTVCNRKLFFLVF
jgi:hypothetical protein